MFPTMAEPVRDLSSSPGLILQVGSSHYRVRGSAGSEIAPCPPLATVPDAPHWLLGIGLHKNEAIPVVHLQALLEGQPCDPSRAARILVMRTPPHAVAYLVNDIDPERAVGEGGHEADDLDLLDVGRVLMAHAFWAAAPQ